MVQQIANHEFVVLTGLRLQAKCTRPETKRIVDYTPSKWQSFEKTSLRISAKAYFRLNAHLQATSAPSKTWFYSVALPYGDGSVTLPSAQDEPTPLCSRRYKDLQGNESLKENEGHCFQDVSKVQ
jgi:hypothetical protein